MNQFLKNHFRLPLVDNAHGARVQTHEGDLLARLVLVRHSLQDRRFGGGLVQRRVKRGLSNVEVAQVAVVTRGQERVVAVGDVLDVVDGAFVVGGYLPTDHLVLDVVHTHYFIHARGGQVRVVHP